MSEIIETWSRLERYDTVCAYCAEEEPIIRYREKACCQSCRDTFRIGRIVEIKTIPIGKTLEATRKRVIGCSSS